MAAARRWDSRARRSISVRVLATRCNTVPASVSARRRRLLLVAGAGAGVAAIFKTPATGAVFALEVPYQDDLARYMLGPTLIASATSYLVFVAIHGTAPLLVVTGSPPFDFKDLAAAVLLGMLAGVGARVFAWMIRRSKDLVTSVPVWIRVPLAGAALAAIFVVARVVLRAEPDDRSRLRHHSLGARSDPQRLARGDHPHAPLHRDVGHDRRGRRRWALHPVGGRRRLDRAHRRRQRARARHVSVHRDRRRRRSSVPDIACLSRRSCSSPRQPDVPASWFPVFSRLSLPNS